jgi:hypothetical protein
MSDIILFSLNFRILSPEFFPSFEGNGFCAGLTTRRFTIMSNLTYRSKHTFLGIFTSALSEPAFVVQSVNLSHVKFIFITFLRKYTHSTMACMKKMCNEDTDSQLICDTKSNEHVEGTESTKDEDDYSAPPMQVQMMK